MEPEFGPVEPYPPDHVPVDQLHDPTSFFLVDLCSGLFMLLSFAFWGWMLYDCIRNDPDRGMWVVILLFTHVIGALIYFVVRKLPSMRFQSPSFFTRFSKRQDIVAAEAAARNIGNAHQFVILGDLYQEVGNRTAAREAYDKAVQKEDDNIQALWGLACVELAQKDFPAARQHLEKVLDIDPEYKFGDPYVAYGQVLLDLGETAAARQHLEKHLNRWQLPAARIMLAEILLEDGETEKARAQAEDVLTSLRAGPRFHYHRNRRWVHRAKRILRQTQ